MPTKLQFYSELADVSAKRLTATRKQWTDFLTTSARLYKYPYNEQLMIFAQRPDAVACAPLEMWNQPMNRYVKRGSKGIALIDETNGKPRLRYVFDFNDTLDGSRNPKRPYLWELQQEHQTPVMEALTKTYGDMEGDLPEMFRGVASQLTAEYYDDNAREIVYSTEDSFLEEYDEFNVSVAFREALTVSVTYSLMSRCGLDPTDYLTDEDFQCIFDFNTPQSVYALGTAVSNLSEQVLREIEVTIKKYERNKVAERSFEHGELDLHTERRLSNTGYIADRATGRADWQVRTNAEGLSQETPSNIVQYPAPAREAVPPSVGDRQDGEQAVRAVDERIDGTNTTAGQSDRADGVGVAYEQPQSDSGGNDTGRIDLQLNNEAPQTPSEPEQSAQGGVSLSETLAGTAISANVVDTILRDGSNFNDSTLRITAQYMKDKPSADNVDFLKEEYRQGGKGFVLDGRNVSAWFDEGGMRIAYGHNAEAANGVNISWEQLESRIGELLNNGEYITQTQLDTVIGHDHKALADRLWYLHQDTEGNFFIPDDVFRGGFPDSTERIAALLAQPEQRAEIIRGLQGFCTAYEQDPSILRFRGIHNPQKLLQNISDLGLPLKQFTAQNTLLPLPPMFITENEIMAYTTRGNNVSEGKFRIYSYFLHEHSMKEKADFLKEEYGTGGSTHALSGGDRSYEDHSSRGVTLSKGGIGNPAVKLDLTWTNMASRINDAINEGRYMSQRELEHLPYYERTMLGAGVQSFFSNLPQDVARPVSVEIGMFGDYWGYAEKIGATLDNPETVADILAAMKPIVEVTHPDDRNYSTRQKAYEDLTAFQNGTYTLFPQLDYVQTPQITVSRPPQIAFDDMPVTTGEQISLFATEQQQREIITETIAQAEQAASVQEAAFSITQSDIDTALQAWNGDVDSKIRVAEYMHENARARDTAAFLKGEYGGDLSAFTVTKGELEQTLPWAKVQRRVAQLMDEGQFLTADEQALADSRLNETWDNLAAENTAQDIPKPETSEQEEPPAPEILTQDTQSTPTVFVSLDCPPPVFFADWREAQHDFDLSLYRDGDIVGYNKDGVEYALGKSGNLTYITTTTSITPWGDILGDSDIPRNIREQMVAFRNGNLSETQARDNYLQVLTDFKAQKEAARIETAPLETAPTQAAPQADLSPQARFNLAKEAYPDHIVMTQLGDFYEFYGDDALFVSSEMGFTLTGRNVDGGERLPLVGIPLYNTETVVSQLLEHNQSVVLIDSGGKMTERLPDLVSEYILDYRYVNDRLIVQNIYNYDPDEFPPIVARVEPDGSIIILDENLPEKERLDIERVVATELDWYKAEAETQVQQMLDFAEAVNERFEREMPSDLAPAPHQWSVGDRFYFNTDRQNTILSIGERGVIFTNNSYVGGVTQILPHSEFAYKAKQEPPVREWKDGDMVYLEDDKPFRIASIGRFNYHLDDLTFPMIGRSLSHDEFNFLAHQRPQTPHVLVEVISSAPIPIEEVLLNQERQAFLDQGGVQQRPTPQSIIQTPQPPTQQEQQITPTHIPVNFHITDDHLGGGGAKTKFGYNVAAINLLKQLESENRLATPDEQQILSRYVGWGGLPQAFDGENRDWKKEYSTLKDLLTPTEYDMARASTLNAHYTSPTVIKAIYDTVERMGFRSGNILEPACGVGNFLGLLPESMQSSKLYGVELDSITGRLAKQLYQKADITISGFEKTATPDSFFDLAIGNVPFGSYGVADKRYDKNNFLIHDYFFAKTLDQVRPGGIVAFITSKGTLDKQNSEVRKYIAQRAELLGAVRLPNNAFKANAGTEVTSDILFFQKRDRLIDIQPDWVHLSQTEDGIPVNSYFAENPQMMLGTMARDDMMYGNRSETTCMPFEGADLAEQLRAALSHIQGQITEIELDDIEGIEDTSIPADPTVRNYSYTLVDDKVYYRENSIMYPIDVPNMTYQRIKGMTELRDCVHQLIDYQLHEYSEADITAKQGELNRLYDAFSAKYGLLDSYANRQAYSNDTAYYLLCSLEILNENNELERKADMFTKRTIKQKTVITSVDTSSEALAVSIAERACVDIGFMQSLTGFDSYKIIKDLEGVIFQIPAPADETPVYISADEYLSGNVREKLAVAREYAEQDPMRYIVNVAALEKSQPKDLEASEISVRLGSTWIDKDYIQQFMYEQLQTPYNLKNICAVKYSGYTGEWNITGKGRVPSTNVLACVTFGTGRKNAYEIMEDTLNLRDVRVYDTKFVDGVEKRVLNKKETTLAQQKQEALKQAFKEWIFKDPHRRHDLVKLYNERFNSDRPREYDGSHINFEGISPDISLRSHQLNAIAHIMYGGNTLLAHEVGAGKTFEMVAAAMESKRLGLCNKSLMAVPNHLTEQMASEFLRLYPSANILVATAKDFEMRNRRKFCAKIATGDYDAVIIGHSQLEKIPLSKERQERLLREQIWEITEGIDELKRNQGERFSIKQLEKTKKSLETRLQKLTDGSRKDDVVTFEQLGVDRLFVDEAHGFKNLFLYTKMRNVAGLSQTEAQKSSDLFGKCRYLDELTGNKGVIFATGTPISNSMTEMYTMQRYLQYDTLQRNGLTHFDSWASTFGETTTAIELAPEGTGYRARTRFAKFHNLPELMCMFKEVADIKTADMLDLPRPKANYKTVVVKPTELQQDMVKDLSERAAVVHANGVDPSIDNMLKITSDGRKIGLDQRLISPLLPDDEGSKVNACMNNVFQMWQDTQADRLTQLVFCDFSTPNSDGRFNVYDDIRAKLLEKGIPESEIAFIHDANTEAKKKELFSKVRKGQVRVMFGSTAKMGSGTNVQDRLIMLHDLDCPWRPSDLEQRAGRIVRQGNMNPEVYVCRYVTESTFDAYLYQTVENKQKFISQIMSSKSPVRSCEDVDETALSYAEIKALCAGNPLIKEKMDLDIEVARLRLLKADHQSQHYRLEDELIRYFPQNIEKSKEQIAGFESDKVRLAEGTKENADGFSPMVINGVSHTDKGKAGASLIEACKQITSTEPVNVGSYRGFDMNLSFDTFNKTHRLTLKGTMSYPTDLGTDTFGNITRINNVLGDLPQRLTSVQAHMENLYQQMDNAKIELQKPFPLEAALAEKSGRLAVLDAELNIDKGGEPEQLGGDDDVDIEVDVAERVPAKGKPSILETLRNGISKDKPQGNTEREKAQDTCL